LTDKRKTACYKRGRHPQQRTITDRDRRLSNVPPPSPVIDRDRHYLLNLQQLFRVSYFNPAGIVPTVFLNFCPIPPQLLLNILGYYKYQEEVHRKCFQPIN
jgi:hypothetical protein